MELVKGSVYRVSAYVGSNAAGEPKLFTNSCGGSVELLSTLVKESPPPKGSVDSKSESEGSAPIPLVLFAGTLLLFVGAALLRQLRISRRI
jgi:hypothetical protein